jgi:hypothetical protein
VAIDLAFPTLRLLHRSLSVQTSSVFFFIKVSNYFMLFGLRHSTKPIMQYMHPKNFPILLKIKFHIVLFSLFYYMYFEVLGNKYAFPIKIDYHFRVNFIGNDQLRHLYSALIRNFQF